MFDNQFPLRTTNTPTQDSIDDFFFISISENDPYTQPVNSHAQLPQSPLSKTISKQAKDMSKHPKARSSASKKKYGQTLNMFARYFLANREKWVPYQVDEETEGFLRRFLGSAKNSEYSAETLKKISEIMKSTKTEIILEFDTNFTNFFKEDIYEHCVIDLYKGNKESKDYLLKNRINIMKKIRSQYHMLLELC